MDAFMSLPMLSFLLIPTMSSYSTSLNLLFFYMTWSTLVLSNPPLKVEIVGTLAVRILFYLLPSLFFYIFDAAFPSAAIALKAQGDVALPSRKGVRRQELKVLGWSSLNLVTSVLVQSLVELLFTRGLKIRSALKVTTTLPMPWSIAKDLLRGWLAREVIQYVFHRYILHDQRSPITKYHEKWYHALETPYPMTAHYDHPLAYMFFHFLPTYIPTLVFRFHLLTFVIYMALISLEETFSYSGYSTVPTNFILGGVARRTDNHVICGGKGNFGPWGLCDWVCGTSVGSDLVEDVRAEGEKHEVGGRVDSAVERAKKKGRQQMGRGKGKSRQD